MSEPKWPVGLEAQCEAISARKAQDAITQDLINSLVQRIARLSAELESANNRAYPHMCRDEHEEIGHSNSENERCPLCVALDENATLRATVNQLKKDYADLWNKQEDIGLAMASLLKFEQISLIARDVERRTAERTPADGREEKL